MHSSHSLCQGLVLYRSGSALLCPLLRLAAELVTFARPLVVLKSFVVVALAMMHWLLDVMNLAVESATSDVECDRFVGGSCPGHHWCAGSLLLCGLHFDLRLVRLVL